MYIGDIIRLNDAQLHNSLHYKPTGLSSKTIPQKCAVVMLVRYKFLWLIRLVGSGPKEWWSIN